MASRLSGAGADLPATGTPSALMPWTGADYESEAAAASDASPWGAQRGWSRDGSGGTIRVDGGRGRLTINDDAAAAALAAAAAVAAAAAAVVVVSMAVTADQLTLGRRAAAVNKGAKKKRKHATADGRFHHPTVQWTWEEGWG